MSNNLNPLKCWTTTCQTCKAKFRYHEEQIKDAERSKWVICPTCERFTEVPGAIGDRISVEAEAAQRARSTRQSY